ncbi:MAG: alpha/beta hydrolase [Marinobacter sp.]|uniref:alpha/beta hydrolase n=1 Tax=Marinobacter sp. TaxID=50741 RepID=UPI00299D4529|nr:alpha/beta hydrolase [Marinobacter sp.]MDX1756143.1 alpha/beta hydrolase [Marinobacter sp.]
MKRHNRLKALFIFLVAWNLAGCSDPGIPFIAHDDLEFRRVGDQVLRLDLRVPDNGLDANPAIVFIHGGGWVGGDRAGVNRQVIEELARHGFVTASVSYRLAPETRYPGQLNDVQAAIRWLREHARDYRVDPQRIGAAGFSAGAYLAAMLGVTGGGAIAGCAGDAADQQAPVKAVVSWAGGMNLLDGSASSEFIEHAEAFLGGTADELPDLYRHASPLTHVSACAPPFLLIHGEDDTYLASEQALTMAAALRKGGVMATVEVLPNAPHYLLAEDHLADALSLSAEFLQQVLKD